MATQELAGNPCNIGTRNWRHPDQCPMSSMMQIRLKIRMNTPSELRNCCHSVELLMLLLLFVDEMIIFWVVNWCYRDLLLLLCCAIRCRREMFMLLLLTLEDFQLIKSLTENFNRWFEFVADHHIAILSKKCRIRNVKMCGKMWWSNNVTWSIGVEDGIPTVLWLVCEFAKFEMKINRW